MDEFCAFGGVSYAGRGSSRLLHFGCRDVAQPRNRLPAVRTMLQSVLDCPPSRSAGCDQRCPARRDLWKLPAAHTVATALSVRLEADVEAGIDRDGGILGLGLPDSAHGHN